MNNWGLTPKVIGIERHRLQTDGEGVSTLVAFHGCPLRCRYCLNPQSRDEVCVGEEEIVVKGRVTDSVGNPLVSARIVEKGTTRGTCSDKDGCFKLRVSGRLPICISYVGYETKEVWVPKCGFSDLRVVLNTEVIALNEIESDNYLRVHKKYVLTGAVVTMGHRLYKQTERFG
ncbi:carboxypeptidase-like regulatory domain-containing protein [Butyricimonas sp. DFI.6.44]|nr:carboxypeptidase-like regulatory domain-containing protein [Butyricimonas sp. DFI.6.44]MCB6973223.1 carboxypeptidase-like regulatory domain-containing protein [Butyricimonas synergistica]MCG4519859.1 carboxypeptidase-like regulatory domain-containing protein [Butyricimonas sp. DFI.6.44]